MIKTINIALISSGSLLIASLLGATLQGCGTAQYEFIKAPKEGESSSRFLQKDTPSFSIKGTPTTVKVGEAVQFEGTCGINNQGTLTWSLGDGTTRSGKSLTHKYTSAKTYHVEAVCNGANDYVKTGTLLIKVVSNKSCGCNTPNQSPNQRP